MKNKLYIPIWNDLVTEKTRKTYVELLKKAGCKDVFLASGRHIFHMETDSNFELLKENIEYFEKEGFTVAVWTSTLGYGDPLQERYKPFSDKFTRIRSALGVDASDAFCPLDKDFLEKVLRHIDRIAKCGAKMIMLDDELCLSVRPGLGCFCENHMKLYEEYLGESLKDKDLKTLFFTGGKNKYRDAFLKIEGDTLRNFAKACRNKLDETDKNIRLGFCAGYTSWDIEGVDAVELTKIMAGDNKPFLRFTGAPYWVARTVNRFPDMHLNSVIEMARLQEKWARNSGVEVFAEGDSYPRPRYQVPANLIECFDTAVSASGGMGDLKYMMDYASSPEYEMGYLRHHEKNAPLRAFIEKNFENKTTDGVFVAEKMHKFADMDLGENFRGEEELMYTAFSPAAALLSQHAIPTTYEESDIAIAFGENVSIFEKLPEKLILDVTSAEILKNKGVDVGLLSKELAPSPAYETTDDEQALLYRSIADHYDCSLNENAKVLSWFDAGGKKYPAAYSYKTQNTEFLVFTFDAYTLRYDSSVMMNYIRQEQLLSFIGGKFPQIKKEPCLYQLLKRDEKETAILLENLWEDSVFDFYIDLDGNYKDFEIFGAEASLNGDKLHINSEIPAFGMMAILLKK